MQAKKLDLPQGDIGKIEPIAIVDEVKKSYLEYAMSVIVSRALPDVRDGLKPVHRRILYAMWNIGLRHTARYRKSAHVVGEVMAKYHPHGDSSIYEAMVRMAQDFSMRHQLVDGQGNFGCFTKDTKVKLTDGRDLSFEDLVKEYEQGKENYTYTINSAGLIAIAKVEHPRLTKKNAEIMKVVLDNGEEIRCTLNHLFMTKSGEYKEAKDLQPGESLMTHEQTPAKNILVAGTELLNQYEDVYDLTVDGTHNFALAAGVFVHNSMDGDSAAAMRYTEAKLKAISAEVLSDIEKETVNFIPTYDGSHNEPTVLPTRLPLLLLNGTMGIAVGMATSIPPHNLAELCDGILCLINNPKAGIEELCELIKGPDFPTGAIIYNKKDILNAYATGRGGIVMRAKTEIVEGKAGYFNIIVNEIPYQINKSEMIEKIATLVQEKKIEGIRDLRDESNKDGVRIVIELKKDAYPQKVLNHLYKLTELQTTFHLNLLALIDGIQPRVLNLKTILEEFIKHRQIVIRRRTEFDLLKAKDRAHILEGLQMALDKIDLVIKTIRASKDKDEAKVNLISKFKFTDRQATAILEMKLQQLANLESQKIEDELKEKKAIIKELESILASEKKILGIIKQETEDIKTRFGDERRTKIVSHGVKEFTTEDLIPNEPTIIMVTEDGYIKRITPDMFHQQSRGGKGVIGVTTKEEDVVEQLITTNTHDNVLFFTNRGRVFQLMAYDLPAGTRTAKGQALVNFLQLAPNEKVTSLLALGDESMARAKYLVMVTNRGLIKKTAIEDFANVRRSGLIALKLKTDDSLEWVKPSSGTDEIMIATKLGQAIHFREKDVRPMGRSAAGVRGMKLRSNDSVICMDIVDPKNKSLEFLTVGENGVGKRTPLDEYKIQGRGGSGIKTAEITAKTGNLIQARIVDKVVADEQDLMIISAKGQVIRLPFKSISTSGRATQGVRLMRFKEEGDRVVNVTML